MTKRPKSESGYSLVEVLAAIVILTIAIIPMVAMFDTGLRSATTSGNYDKARSLANTNLEQAKSLSYETVRDSFPNGTAAPNPTSTSSNQDTDPPSAFTYVVTKRFIDGELGDSGTDEGLMKITVTVCWNDTDNVCGNGNSSEYSAAGVVAE